MAFALPATTADGRIIQNTAISTKSHIPTTSIRRFAKPFPYSCFHPFLQTKTTPMNFCFAISSSTGRILFHFLYSHLDVFVIFIFWRRTCSLELSKALKRLPRPRVPPASWTTWWCLIWMEWKSPFLICGKIGKLLLHLLDILGDYTVDLCVLCRKRADYLANEKDKLDAAGVALVLIGPGSVDQAKTFSEQTKFQGEVYADPSYSSYKALNFVSGVSTTFSSGAGLKVIKAYLEGYRQDWALSFEKDTRTRGGWQQGGIIVAGPGKNNISYVHKDKEAGDEPDIEDILKACCLQGV